MMISFSAGQQFFFRTMRPWGVLVVLLLLLCLGTSLLNHVKEREEEAEKKTASETREEPFVNVEVMTLQSQPLISTITFPGMIRPWETLVLKAEIGGRILTLLHEKGEEVEAGAVIARVEDRDYRAAASQAEAALIQAKQSFTRVQKLREQGALSQAEHDRATSLFTQAQAASDSARYNLERCEIRTPIAGFINQRYITQGSQVSVGGEIVEILDLRQVRIDVGIPERDAVRLRHCQSAELKIQALDNVTVTARRIYFSAKPMDQGLLYLLQLELPNPDRRFVPGMFVEATFIREERPETLIIPLAAVLPRDNQYFGYIASGEKAEQRQLLLGTFLDRRVEVVQGLTVGEMLVIKGHHQLEPGQALRIVPGSSSLEARSLSPVTTSQQE